MAARSLRRSATAASAALAVLLGSTLAGCGSDPAPPPASRSTGQVGDPEDGARSLQDSLDAVESSMTDAAAALRTADETPQDGVIRLEQCASDPTPAAQINAYGRLVGGSGPLVPRLQQASERMQDSGWTEAGTDLSDSNPAIGLTKGSAQLVLTEDARRGGDAVWFTITGPCYRYDDLPSGFGVSRPLDFAP